MMYDVGHNLDDKFRICQIYEGGMALVYIVEDIETGRKAAAKTMREEMLSDPMLIARFKREMRIWVGLGNHPNIVRAFFVKDIDSFPFLFMEYMDGGSLFDLLENSTHMQLLKACATCTTASLLMDSGVYFTGTLSLQIYLWTR